MLLIEPTNSWYNRSVQSTVHPIPIARMKTAPAVKSYKLHSKNVTHIECNRLMLVQLELPPQPYAISRRHQEVAL